MRFTKLSDNAAPDLLVVYVLPRLAISEEKTALLPCCLSIHFPGHLPQRPVATNFGDIVCIKS
jgi:hypothetical protein